MLAALLARFLSDRAAKLVSGVLPFVLVAGGVWWVAGLQRKVKTAEARSYRTELLLKAEEAARIHDVTALTILNKGAIATAVGNKRDATILSETIDASKAIPATPALADLMRRLREADTAAAVQRATAGTGGAATR